MDRSSIIKEYFELRDHLNRANKLSNQQTDLKFEIEQGKLFEFRLYAISVGEHETHKIAISERTPRKTWERTGYTRFSDLEEFCSQFLNKQEDRMLNSSKILTNEILKFLSAEIISELKMLLLNKIMNLFEILLFPAKVALSYKLA